MNKNIVVTTILGIFLVFGAFFALPAQKAEAFDLLDPFCLFDDCDGPTSVDNSINNSYNNNVNSFNTQNNNNGGAVYNATSPYSTTQPTTPVNNNYNYNYNTSGPTYSPAPVYYYSTPTYYPTPTYYYPPTTPYQQYNPLTVTCRANTTYASTGTYVRWTAYPSGGYYSGNYANYSYSWSGTDGLYGSSSSVGMYYNTSGYKVAYVTVYSGSQSVTVQCSDAVNIYGTTYYQQPVYVQPQPIAYNPGLQIACAADTASTRIGTPVTWSVEVLGPNYGSYSYSWSGSGGLSGSQSSAVVTYGSPGTKSAVVTVVAPNGYSQSKACSNTVYVKGNTVAQAKPVQTPPPQQTPQYVPPTPESAVGTAASIFSLGNVPWGWVAIIIILMLLGIIFYQIYNSKKI